jgi:hypothetical protein
MNPSRTRTLLSLLTLAAPAVIAACFSKASSTSAGSPGFDASFDGTDFDVTTPGDGAPDSEGRAPIDSGSHDAGADADSAAPVEAGPPIILSTTVTAPYALVVNATDVYWTQDLSGVDGGTLLSVPIDGGATTTLSTGSNGYALALDGNSVYWDQGVPCSRSPSPGARRRRSSRTSRPPAKARSGWPTGPCGARRSTAASSAYR